MDDLGGPLDLGFDLFRGFADRIHALHSLPQQIVQDGVVAPLVFASEDDMYVGGE